MTLQDRLAEETSALRFEDLPSEVIHETKRRVLDSLGCAVSALKTEVARIVSLVASSAMTEDGATLWGTKKRLPPDFAAFANGALVRYWDFNDTYLSLEPAHPSDNIAPCIAVAEAFHRNGRDLITAIVLAYEIQCRLADSASLRERGFDHVNYGLFSVVCNASKLMGLTKEQTSHAIAIAGVAHISSRQTRAGEISFWKACAFSNAARNAIFSAKLAKAGMTGPSNLFEGRFGFFRLVSGEFDLAPMAWSNSGDGHFKILDTYIKPFPAEYHAQSAIEAALRLRQKIPSVDLIENIRVDTHEAAYSIIGSEPEKWQPKTRETADHSLPYLVAVALIDGEVTLKQYTPERIADPKLQQLIQKVKVYLDPELDKEYPQAFPNSITVTLKSQKDEPIQELERYPKGHPKKRMEDKEIEEKFKQLSDGILSAQTIEKIISTVWKLDELDDIQKLSSLLTL